ncbi:MAG: hypothetical protein HC906_19080 [Bacteroidales bacterium]|nr:hypothetical protein [Bacteroidales bacterium]
MKHITVTAGVFFDQYLSGKLKRKYKVEGSKNIEVIRNNDFNDYFLNKTKYGFDTSIKFPEIGIGLGFTSMITPSLKKISDRRFTKNA